MGTEASSPFYRDAMGTPPDCAQSNGPVHEVWYLSPRKSACCENLMPDWPSDRLIRRLLFAIALSGLVTGGLFWFLDRTLWAQSIWALTTLPVIVELAISIVRDLAAGRFGVDAIALLSMMGALLLGENLAGVVVAIMYSGGNLLEDYAVGRAERDLKSLVIALPELPIDTQVGKSKTSRWIELQ